MKRLVSIVTTVYNAEKFIATAVNSVFSQITNDDIQIEYIIVNDCSPDNSMLLIDRFIALWTKTHDGNIPKNITYNIIKPEKNLGCGGARKYGIEHTHGDYLMFLDADDYYLNNNFVQKAVDAIESTQSDMIEYGLIYNQSNGHQKESVVDHQITIENNPAQALISLYKNNFIKFHVWTKIIRREIVEQFAYSEQRTFEDVMTIPVWVSLCKKITIMPSVEINYRSTENSIIREKILDTRIGTIKAIAANFERFKQWRSVLLAMYNRSMIDLSIVLENKTSDDPGFNEMSRLNTYMLSYIMPQEYKLLTYNIEDDENDENDEN